ncbi:TonB-dependent receptor domain-containing protein [Luteimonas sp. R10]|uniref:TonB-dependent receptor domain-containing protein n=1 Tax=Luteimonas sp. R10 TaxID=3108176 RepID=UPI00308C1E37|nr:TonB-dependent receptor [Luteimonas sp. R10]
MSIEEGVVVVEPPSGRDRIYALERTKGGAKDTLQAGCGPRAGTDKTTRELRAHACGFRLALARRVLAVSLASLLPLHAATAQETVPTGAVHAFDLPAGDLALALEAFGAQSGIHPEYPPGLVDGKQAQAVRGQMGWREALDRLLLGSGLAYVDADGKVVITARTRAAAGPAPAGPARAAAQAEPEATDLASVTVTGTRIRGGTTPSPVITIGAERMQEEGFTDLGEVIRSVPQNFSGGQNPEVGPFNIAGAGTGNSNVTGGSALNLRGLGADASLTLLNGRRMSYGGHTQAIDIAAIPVEAVERIEIVADGASAIYGSDAVGGVANVVLKRDFDGFAAGARYGAATDGGMNTREYTATAGTRWTTGGMIATYKDVSVDPIRARQRSYTDHLREPYTIYPASDLRSGVLSIYESIGTVAELRLDALKSERAQDYTIHLSPSNRQSTVTSDTSNLFVAPGVAFYLPNDWTLAIDATAGRSEHDQLTERTSLTTGQPASSTQDCLCNESRMYELGAEGPVFELPGGDARMAVGAGYRENEFRHYDHRAGMALIGGEDSSRFAYAELSLPLMTAREDDPRRLVLTAAVRGEDYDSFGGVTTPKLGLVHSPGRDFTMKASWGKSFKAPTLAQLHRARIGQVSYAGSLVDGYPAEATVLLSGGGNGDLGPERATTWSASLAFHPEAVPGLEAELTWFDVDYTDRVVEPVNFALGIDDPANAEWVNFAPSVQEQEALIAAVDDFRNFTGAPYDPDRVVAIVRSEFVNATRQRIRGMDASASYRTDIGAGRLTMRGSASWLDSEQQTTSTAGFEMAGTLFNPPKVTARLGAVWTEGGFGASLFANYKGGVENTIHDEKTSSFTTFDTTLRYAADRPGSAWTGLEIALSVQNLLDRAPPLHSPITDFAVPPYDGTNYSAVGRFMALSVSKRW